MRKVASPLRAVAFAMLFVVPAAVGAVKANREMADNFAFETSAFMKETAHAVHRSPPPDWQTQTGALRLNARWETDKSAPWFIEEQQLGGEYIAAGVALNNKEDIQWGLKIVEWGFARMEPDGLFNHKDCYHSASFFLESTAHGLLLLDASSWRTEFGEQIKALKSKVRIAARWMARPEVRAWAWDELKPEHITLPRCPSERPYGHRRFLDAAALGEAGVLLDDKELTEKSAEFIRDAIAFQRADGVNPEKGGQDHHYQALGLVYACRYYQIVADDAMRAEMRPMMDKAFAWLLARVKPDSTVDITGNTRTGLGQEKARNGKPKGLEYRFTSLCLGHWAQLTQNPALEKTALRVFEADAKMRESNPEMAWDGY